MLCTKPYRQGSLEFGCGQCGPCRINKRREWTARLLLEANTHAANCVATLTFKPDSCPQSVSRKDVAGFMKRLRARIYPIKVRYYGVGEYGSRSERPHYHIALFGLGTSNTVDIQLSWKNGFVHVAPAEPMYLAYCCSHITKMMHFRGDPRLEGREPEFQRMSLNKGIGYPAVDSICDWLTTEEGSRWLMENGDVPGVFRAHGQIWPFGRYLRSMMREKLGRDVGAPAESLKELSRKEGLIFETKGYDWKVGRRQRDKSRAAAMKRDSIGKQKL